MLLYSLVDNEWHAADEYQVSCTLVSPYLDLMVNRFLTVLYTNSSDPVQIRTQRSCGPCVLHSWGALARTFVVPLESRKARCRRIYSPSRPLALILPLTMHSLTRWRMRGRWSWAIKLQMTSWISRTGKVLTMLIEKPYLRCYDDSNLHSIFLSIRTMLECIFYLNPTEHCFLRLWFAWILVQRLISSRLRPGGVNCQVKWIILLLADPTLPFLPVLGYTFALNSWVAEVFPSTISRLGATTAIYGKTEELCFTGHRYHQNTRSWPKVEQCHYHGMKVVIPLYVCMEPVPKQEGYTSILLNLRYLPCWGRVDKLVI